MEVTCEAGQGKARAWRCCHVHPSRLPQAECHNLPRGGLDRAMVSGLTNVVFNLVGWSIIPDFATKQALRFLNTFLATYFNVPVPPPGSPSYVKRYRLTLSFAIFSYLCYSLYQGSRSIEPNFYEVLGVPVDVDEAGLKTAFKGFARKYHPDRPGVGLAGAELFMKTRKMYESLKDPVARFAYDRFGPDALDWEGLVTEREYLRRGMISNSMYHIVSFVFLQFWSAFGEPSPVAFWRYILYAFLFVYEFALLISPPPSLTSLASTVANNTTSAIFSSTFQDPTSFSTHRTLLHIIFPQRVEYQHIIFLHHLFVFLSVALSRVAPQLFPGDPPASVAKLLVDRVTDVATAADRETGIMLHTVLHSVHPIQQQPNGIPRPTFNKMQPKTNLDPGVMKTLTSEMRDMIIEANLRKDTEPIAGAWKDAIVRGRALSLKHPKFAARHMMSKLGGKTREDEIGEDGEDVTGEGILPSPRPSPPPRHGQASPQRPTAQRTSSHVRARSISC
ncbi:hypothetical protein ONZ45_g17466 [Pleurotus djamor]|nr:hypothetical protein ONZ45_g17466 [Pleurotus djamor]